MITTRKRTGTHQRLLQDLREIKAVLEVESQLMKALLRIANARRVVGLQLSF
jgi:hypothetical protein